MIEQKQSQNVEYVNYLVSRITKMKDGTCKVKSQIQFCHGKSSIKEVEGIFARKLDLNQRNKLSLYGAKS
jgi:hypothetical protein